MKTKQTLHPSELKVSDQCLSLYRYTPLVKLRCNYKSWLWLFYTILYKIHTAMPIGSFSILPPPSSGIRKQLSINPPLCRLSVRYRVHQYSRQTSQTDYSPLTFKLEASPGLDLLEISQFYPGKIPGKVVRIALAPDAFHWKGTDWLKLRIF